MLFPWKSICALQALLSFAEAYAGGRSPLGAVATESDICTKIGKELLEAGGSAADAMVAAVLCVGVVAPYNSGIGGGGFATIRRSNGTYDVVNFREKAPAAVHEDSFKDESHSSVWGGLASGVPGQIRGLQYIHENYGNLPWKAVVEPAATLADKGWLVNEDTVQNMGWGLDYSRVPDFLSKVPTWAIDFAPNGTLLGLGDRISRKRLGATLHKIANEGPDAFYTGAIAGTMVAALSADDGVMTLDDLADYSVDVTPAINITYRNHTVYSCNAPCSGPVVLNTLKTLEGYDDFFTAPSKTQLSYHRLIEAIKFGYGRRTKLGDPAYVEGVPAFVNGILTDQAAKETRSKISDTTTQPPEYYNPDGREILKDHGTSHMVAADSSGLGISLTTTIYLSFGSQLMIPETGIIMNNNMDGFSIPDAKNNSFGFVPSPENYPAPGKRPMTSMSPCIVESTHGNSFFFYLIGAEGGSRIPSANIQNIISVLDRGMTAKGALSEPRLHSQLLPDVVEFEYPFDNVTVVYLKALGHVVTWTEPVLTAAQGIIAQLDRTYEAASEPRQAWSQGSVAFKGKNDGVGLGRLYEAVRSFSFFQRGQVQEPLFHQKL